MPHRILRKIADSGDPASLASRLRRRRARFFASLLNELPRPVRLLDVGGTAAFWSNMDGTLGDAVEVTILNLSPAAPSSSSSLRMVTGDARALPFEDQVFDAVFSNSVLEHVGAAHDQRRMADEIRRVGARYFVQTPNRYFPIEPHFLFPMFQFLPIDLRAWMLSKSRLGWHPRAPDLVSARSVVEDVRLLDEAQLRDLFPGCRVFQERFLGLTKSLIAYAGWS